MHSVRQTTRTLVVELVNKQYPRFVAANTAIEHSNEKTEELKCWRDIPGPASLPIVGPMLHFLPGGEFYKIGPEIGGLLYKKYGPIVRLDGIFGSKPIIFLLDAEASANVLRSENWLPIRPGFQSLEYFRKHVKGKGAPDLETGLLTEHGESWKKFRSTVNPILLHTKIVKQYATTLDEIAEDMVNRMRLKRNEKNILDCEFDVEMNLWSLESIASIALGTRLYCFDPKLPEDAPAKRLIQLIHDVMHCFNLLDFRPSLWRHIATPTYRRLIKLLEEQLKLNNYFINKAVKQRASKNKADDSEKSVLEKLMEINEDVAVTMASDMLFAGTDTAANVMIATLYLLASNPEKQKKLRDEINSGSEKRTYTKACIKESMRMMPVVAGNIRQTTKDYNLLGYRIPKDMDVTFGHQFMSMLDEHYPRSSEFIPERWIVEKTDPLYHGNAHPFAYSPFGFGARSCIGRRIAELELEIFLAKVIKNFAVEWFGPPPKIKANSLNYVNGPYNFIFKDV